MNWELNSMNKLDEMTELHTIGLDDWMEQDDQEDQIQQYDLIGEQLELMRWTERTLPPPTPEKKKKNVIFFNSKQSQLA